ncbi:MAG TPA: Fic family protein [Ferruginibacter sp.]|nr:Fic family protein [Ferruginibacter sp.]HMP19867.1 Fic family protein [Ferruginibacter sp.]
MRNIEKAPSVQLALSSPEMGQRLIELVMRPEINEIINDINEKYNYWDKVKYQPLPAEIKPEELWVIAKIRRMNTPFQIQFGKYNFSWFQSSHINQLLHEFDLNIGGSLASGSLIPKEEKNRYLISSIMEEAIASSQIEGAVTTRRQAKEMLRKNKPPKNKDEQMIFNNYKTIQKILELKNERLTVKRILEIHKLISADTLPEKLLEGAFRKTNDINVVDVIDGEIVYRPPDNAEIEVLIDELCHFFNNDNDKVFIHPVIKGCIIHFMIGYIHPFVDGNGRTARALFYWYMLKKGYWLTEYLSISKLILRSKAQYARAYLYTETDDNDLTYFIKYKLRTMKLAFESLREYIQRKIEEKRLVSEFIRLEHVNDRQALILKWYYEEPALLLTVKEVETRLAISNQTARNDLQRLTNTGYIDSIRLNLKTEAFVKSNQFDSLLKTHLSGLQQDLFR